ncbi:TPA: hypothetical protein NRM83_005163 [Klebsiella pneumoniae]|nr:hypothetical protein [Klebsiella pneumoniae]HCJ2302224.1 hypothetical protein [Klebsiella pneumoniae]HCJ2532119.1 hypothetical protein [Klebsiella pneumoniae]HCJ3066526.1 hypothetical protein [Klebsiella pneumoniae]HDT7262180.1 hypothetical protein [Klebsiella pneumoniae]
MGNEIEQIAQQNEMSIEFVTWFFNEKKVGCGNVWFMMMAAMWEGWKGRSIEMDKLAAENVGLRPLIAENWNMRDLLRQLMAGRPGGVYFNKWEKLIVRVLNETPATNRIVAGIKADAIDEAAVELDRVDTVASTRVIGFKLREFAKQLREGAK